MVPLVMSARGPSDRPWCDPVWSGGVSPVAEPMDTIDRVGIEWRPRSIVVADPGGGGRRIRALASGAYSRRMWSRRLTRPTTRYFTSYRVKQALSTPRGLNTSHAIAAEKSNT
jgi:hypothetical protein